MVRGLYDEGGEKKAFDACLLPRISLLFLRAQKNTGSGFLSLLLFYCFFSFAVETKVYWI